MRSRCPSASTRGVGNLCGYKLVFNRRGSYRDGGVASIVPTGDESDRVYGVIWELSATDVRKLDEIEDPDAYARETVRVNIGDDLTLDCTTYIAIPQADYVSPDPEYFQILLAAAKDMGLPGHYIETIESLAPARNGAALHNKTLNRSDK